MQEFVKKYWLEGVFLLCAAVLVVSVIMASLIPVIFITGLFFIAVVLWQPLLGFCLLVFLIPLENLTLLLPGWTAIKVIGGVTLISWLLHLMLGKKVFKLHGFIVLLVLYFLWSLLSVAWSGQPEQSLARIISMSQLLLMFVLGYNLVDNREELYLVLGSFLLGALLASCLGIYNSYLSGFVTRASIGDLAKPNYFARAAGLGIIFSVYLMMALKDKALRLAILIGCAALAVAVLLSGSKGAWLALLLAAAALYSSRKSIISSLSKRASLISLAVILFCLVALGPLMLKHTPPVISQRLQTLNFASESIDISSGRLDIWLVGLEIAKDNWAWGVGLDNFPYAFTEYFPRVDNVRADIGLNRDPHNILLANLVELGLPGLLIFVSLFVFLWRSGGRSEKPEDALLAKVTVVFLLIAGLTSTDHCSKYFWLGMLIPVIVSQFYCVKNSRQGVHPARVIFLTAIFPNRFNPNYGIFSLRLVQHLRAIGIPVTVIAPVPYAPPFLRLKKNGWRWGVYHAKHV